MVRAPRLLAPVPIVLGDRGLALGEGIKRVDRREALSVDHRAASERTSLGTASRKSSSSTDNSLACAEDEPKRSKRRKARPRVDYERRTNQSAGR